MASLIFNDRAGRYADSRGRFVAESRVRSVIDGIADATSERLAQAAQRLLNGEMSLAAWQATLMQDVKLSVMAGGIIGRGGVASMSQSDYGYLGRMVRDQYAYARSFAQQIQDGRQPLHAGLISRSRMYGQQARVVFETMRARDARGRGLSEEKNTLHPAEHCRECRSLSALGWVPIGTLPPIGSRQCRANDRCSISRRSASEAAA